MFLYSDVYVEVVSLVAMSLISCVSSKTPDGLLSAIEESVKENAHDRLMHLLRGK